MASKSSVSNTLKKPSKPNSPHTLEGRPPLQAAEASKSDPATPEKSPRSLQEIVSKQVTMDQKLQSSQQKGSANSLADKLDTSLSLAHQQQKSKSRTPSISEMGGSLESIANLEKKTSELAAAKVSDGANSLVKTSGSAKISDRADYVESGKSSMCRGSTSTDVSDESTCSSFSSSVSKPHKANDSRWEAIQAVRAKDGVLGLSHFRLLKRLGCGDIGSVYLSELSGTKSYFAMKVMDKALLASRKKLLRAQTEREILQSLDHPFLPTLYTHFETDKFSCLVMEFCPGGDLHTLRQRQQGKHFSEQAVK